MASSEKVLNLVEFYTGLHGWLMASQFSCCTRTDRRRWQVREQKLCETTRTTVKFGKVPRDECPNFAFGRSDHRIIIGENYSIHMRMACEI